MSVRDIVQVIVKALNGDEFSQKRLEEMKKLDETIKSRFNIDHSLDELIEKARKKSKQSRKILHLPFPS